MARRHKYVTSLFRLTAIALLMFAFMGVTNSSLGQGNQCKIGALPTIVFQSKSAKLLSTAKTMLATVGTSIKENPVCKIVVAGYGGSNKNSQQLSWEHVNVVINYLVEQQGISADRFIFSYGNEGGDVTTVDLRVVEPGEDGPTKIPPPHPGMHTN